MLFTGLGKAWNLLQLQDWSNSDQTQLTNLTLGGTYNVQRA